MAYHIFTRFSISYLFFNLSKPVFYFLWF